MTQMFSKQDLTRLAQIVTDETGNKVQEKNFSMIESRLKARLIKLNIPSIAAYWDYFAKNEREERQNLQSLMTTHHTFFFREAIHFEQLEKWIEANAERIKTRFQQTKTPVKVWSAACSRGQEVYSLAMFLEFSLFKKHGVAFEVVGSDIDSESVEYAKNAVYPIKEVNTIPQKYLNGYWRKGTGDIKDFAAVHPNLRAKARFQTANLLDSATFPKNETFDVIFVRNVFIYFTEEHVRQIALSLTTRLQDGGVFVSGLSEPLRFDGWTLETVAPSTYVKKIASKAGSYIAPMNAPHVAPDFARLSLATTKESKYRVLCVDDSSTIQAVMKKIFSTDSNCAEVVSAMNGQEARKKLDAGKFDVVTLDIHMPIMGGIEFLEKAYRRGIDPPVLMISSVNRTDADLATRALNLGAFDYIEKPAMNNLQKSIDEIITKVKMALRSVEAPESSQQIQTGEDFNKSISQKIVVPDASQCMRWIKANSKSLGALEPIVKLQNAELRSPPMVVSVPKESIAAVTSQLMSWTTRKIETLNDGKRFLRPNTLYVCDESQEAALVTDLKVKSFSLQILSAPSGGLECFQIFKGIQILVDESLGSSVDSLIQRARMQVSDVCPSTSFISLSLEYFANLRKSAAA